MIIMSEPNYSYKMKLNYSFDEFLKLKNCFFVKFIKSCEF